MTNDLTIPRQPISSPLAAPIKDAKAMESAAKALEASFLAEMLKSAGFGEARSDFGGGAGEAAFSDFLVDQYSKEMADSGGIGLAEVIVAALSGKESANA